MLALARAAAPVGLSLLHPAGGGYGPVLWALLLVSLACAVSVLLAGAAAPAPVRRLAAAGA